jgi:hypothetical protein
VCLKKPTGKPTKQPSVRDGSSQSATQIRLGVNVPQWPEGVVMIDS